MVAGPLLVALHGEAVALALGLGQEHRRQHVVRLAGAHEAVADLDQRRTSFSGLLSMSIVSSLSFYADATPSRIRMERVLLHESPAEPLLEARPPSIRPAPVPPQSPSRSSPHAACLLTPPTAAMIHWPSAAVEDISTSPSAATVLLSPIFKIVLPMILTNFTM